MLGQVAADVLRDQLQVVGDRLGPLQLAARRFGRRRLARTHVELHPANDIANDGHSREGDRNWQTHHSQVHGELRASCSGRDCVPPRADREPFGQSRVVSLVSVIVSGAEAPHAGEAEAEDHDGQDHPVLAIKLRGGVRDHIHVMPQFVDHTLTRRLPWQEFGQSTIQTLAHPNAHDGHSPPPRHNRQKPQGLTAAANPDRFRAGESPCEPAGGR